MLGNRPGRWPWVIVSATALSLALPLYAQEGTGEATPPAPSDTPPEGLEEPPVPTVDQVMDHLNDLWRADSSYARVTMTVVTANFNRTLEAESWSLGKDDALIIIRAPAREAGTATLRTDEGLWNYAPRADRLMRIPSGLLSESWMGSHFTNDDLMRESDYLDDYDTTLSWVDDAGTRLLLARSIPHPDAAVVYTRVDNYMTAEDWIPVRAEYFDGDERVRTMLFSNVEEVDGRPIPMTLEVLPDTEPGESTTVHYETLELNADVDASLFTQRGLRRAAQR